ncbi:MAG: Cell death protease [Piccolia ochrophora]|nr:MAG: Cell death protease [Piccolia ochrophora]
MRFVISSSGPRRRSSDPAAVLTWMLASIMLWPRLVLSDKTAADYFVHSLPGAPDGPLLKMHAGHIEVNPEHNGNLWFWHFANRHIANKQRTVIWLNGGPGCSSMDGALMEVGPYRLKDDAHLEYNEGSWDEFTNLLFVDNPVGTGYSYVDTDSFVHELDDMADQFVVFLEKFFAMFPHYEHDDIYFAGESYAGQHIPYIAKAILERNKKPTAKHKWHLEGLIIGNGWIAPTEQYMSYLPMAYKANMVQGGSATAKQLESLQAVCNTQLGENGGTERVDVPECEKILTQLLELTKTKSGEKFSCYNMYDLRLRDSHPSCGMNWPPDLKDVKPYLRRQDVIKALHVDAAKKTGWVECAGGVGAAFSTHNSKPSIDFLPDLLSSMPVLLFSGDQDLICNHVGTEEMIHNMAWNGGKGFSLSPNTWAPRRTWTFEGEAAGIYQSARNLTYVLFYNASHMVPFDYPRRTRDMLDRFLGVDIASIGGAPADSRLDGEASGPQTSVGGHPNSTVAEESQSKKIEKAKWDAYYRAGSVALVFVAAAAAAFGYYVWRDRKRRAGYTGLFTPTANNPAAQQHRRGGGGGSGRHHFPTHSMNGAAGLERFRHKRGVRGGDVEAADFDESELDDLHVASPKETARDGDEGMYALGGASSEEDVGRGGGHKEER